MPEMKTKITPAFVPAVLRCVAFPGMTTCCLRGRANSMERIRNVRSRERTRLEKTNL
jgi:hypothetical protein